MEGRVVIHFDFFNAGGGRPFFFFFFGFCWRREEGKEVILLLSRWGPVNGVVGFILLARTNESWDGFYDTLKTRGPLTNCQPIEIYVDSVYLGTHAV